MGAVVKKKKLAVGVKKGGKHPVFQTVRVRCPEEKTLRETMFPKCITKYEL